MASAASVEDAQSSLRIMRVEFEALGRDSREGVEDSTLRTQAMTMLLGRRRKAAIRPLPIPVWFFVFELI